MSWKMRAALALVVMLFANYLANHVSTVYATPETESAIWKAYNPQRVVKPFTGGRSWTSSLGASFGAVLASQLTKNPSMHGLFRN